MQTTLRLTTRVTAISLLGALLGAVLALGFETNLLPAVPMFAAFGGLMTVVYERDRIYPPVGEKQTE